MKEKEREKIPTHRTPLEDESLRLLGSVELERNRIEEYYPKLLDQE